MRDKKQNLNRKRKNRSPILTKYRTKKFLFAAVDSFTFVFARMSWQSNYMYAC